MIKTLHLKLFGAVQGVGCRYKIERIANELGIRGWVRNVGDSMVEVVAQGDNIQKFLEQIKKLPPPIRIDRLEEGFLDLDNYYAHFVINPSMRDS